MQHTKCFDLMSSFASQCIYAKTILGYLVACFSSLLLVQTPQALV